MRIANLLAVHCVLFGIARGAPTDDMDNLSESCENAAAVLNSSLNNTMAMVRKTTTNYWEDHQVLMNVQNTSDLIQEIMWQVGASTANLGMNETLQSSDSSTNTSSGLDAPYLDVSLFAVPIDIYLGRSSYQSVCAI